MATEYELRPAIAGGCHQLSALFITIFIRSISELLVVSSKYSKGEDIIPKYTSICEIRY